MKCFLPVNAAANNKDRHMGGILLPNEKKTADSWLVTSRWAASRCNVSADKQVSLDAAGPGDSKGKPVMKCRAQHPARLAFFK